MVVTDDKQLCSADGRACPAGTYCGSKYEVYYNGNPYNWDYKEIGRDTEIYELNYNLTNFDNIMKAFLTIFQCITMEGWTKIMNMYQDAFHAWFIGIYFILCVIICSFFLLNLTIAVMLMKYEELDKQQDNTTHKQELRTLGKEINLPPELIVFLLNQDNI